MYIAKKTKQQTANFIEHANDLATKHEYYVSEFVTRGHQELYKILAALYEIHLAIEMSKETEYTIKVLREELRKKHSIKTSPKTSNLAIVIRYVTRASAKTVCIYKRVLSAAVEAKIAPENLAAFITKNGGIDKCGKAIVDAEMQKQQNEQLKIYKKAIWQHVETSAPIAVVNFPNGKVPSKPGAVDVKFTHLICNYNNATKLLEVVCMLYANAHAAKEAGQKIGNKVFIVSGWIVEAYNPSVNATAIIQHWWNADAKGNHFDTTPNLNPNSIYVQDTGLYVFCVDNDAALWTHMGNNLLHKDGKFQVLIDTDLMLFKPVDELKTKYIYNL